MVNFLDLYGKYKKEWKSLNDKIPSCQNLACSTFERCLLEDNYYKGCIDYDGEDATWKI